MTRRDPFMLLCGAGLFAIFSSTVSKSPALPLFATYLGAGPSLVGAVASVSALTGILVSIPAGILSDRLGRRAMLRFSALIFATAPFLYLLIDRLWELALVRFYHGFATAIFIPVGVAAVSDLFRRERGEKIGWFSTATLLGRFIAPVAGGVIIAAGPADPGAGFRAVYLLCGVSGMVAALFILRLPEEDRPGPENAGWPQAFAEFRHAVSNRAILATASVEASILFAYGTFETFLPLYALKSGHTASDVGIILSSQIITLALTKPLMGRFSDRHGRRPQIMLGSLAGALCMAGVAFVQALLPLIVLGVLFGLSISVVTSATSAYIADLSRREGLGSSMGLMGSVMDIGHTTGPLVSGIVAAGFGYSRAFLGASGVLVLICAVFMLTVVVPKSGGLPSSGSP